MSMRKSIFVDDQSSPEYAIEYASPCYPYNGFRLQTQRYKGHWQGRQRSSPTSWNLHISEGFTPKPSDSKRTSSTNSGFLGDEAHKPPCFRRINSRTSGPQEDISVIGGFREDTSNMTKWRDLRPAKSTRNGRTTRPTKVLLPRSCRIDLEGITNGSTEATGAISTTAHIQSTSRVVHLRRTECDVVLSQ
ncbi:hypothetical protein F2Q70_00038349 [Brassica cretica]|uniref:Uncharacterized protein n=1 Tax=Brassica cretica TaxID=69181 RepID=A0A8S9JZV8_BRACR|nr:hypothetical protein F2Q70_00038349 [Brassica cretica]